MNEKGRVSNRVEITLEAAMYLLVKIQETAKIHDIVMQSHLKHS